MELNLKRDLVFFDLEATGLNVIKDRIVQIALVRLHKDGSPETKFVSLVNPGQVPISKEAYQVHGIGADDVRNKPLFSEIAGEVFKFIEGADLGGYNSNRFDIPMLMEELYRAGYELDLESRNLIDVQAIYHKMEPRTLAAAYWKFCGKRMENAHDALVDVNATIEVLKAQLDAYEGEDVITNDGVISNPVRNDMQLLSDFCRDDNILDATRRLKYNAEGEVVFNFGKYVGRPVAETLYNDHNYYNWILAKDFSIQVKKLVKKLRDEYAQRMEP